MTGARQQLKKQTDSEIEKPANIQVVKQKNIETRTGRAASRHKKVRNLIVGPK